MREGIRCSQTRFNHGLVQYLSTALLHSISISNQGQFSYHHIPTLETMVRPRPSPPILGRCLMSLLVYVAGRFLVVIAKLVPSPVPTPFRNAFPGIIAHLTYNHYTAGKGLSWMEYVWIVKSIESSKVF